MAANNGSSPTAASGDQINAKARYKAARRASRFLWGQSSSASARGSQPPNACCGAQKSDAALEGYCANCAHHSMSDQSPKLTGSPYHKLTSALPTISNPENPKNTATATITMPGRHRRGFPSTTSHAPASTIPANIVSASVWLATFQLPPASLPRVAAGR